MGDEPGGVVRAITSRWMTTSGALGIPFLQSIGALEHPAQGAGVGGRARGIVEAIDPGGGKWPLVGSIDVSL